MSTVLVTGATGTIGRETVRALVAKNVDVRVGLRDPARAPSGTKAALLDLEKPETFAAALRGVDRLFLLMPFVADAETPSRALIAEAKRAGVSFVLKLSANGVSEEAAFEAARQHARVERAVQESGMRHAILRPTFFMDNPMTFQRDAIVGQGAFYGASGGRATSYVSSRDVGEVAASVLTAPEAHHGKTYVLTGPAARTDATVAEIHGTALRRDVRFVDLELEAYRAALAAQGMPGWVTDAMVALEDVKRQGWAESVSPDVASVLGRPPESFESFASRHAETTWRKA